MKKATLSVYILFTLIIVVTSAFFSYRLLSYGDETRVPSIIGRTLTEATEQVREQNLQVREKGSEHHASIPVGSIVSQDIPPGSEVKEGQVIGVVLSKGPKTARIPDFSGRTLEEAKALAVSKGVEIARVSSSHHPSVPSGQVISQNPLPGEKDTSRIRLLMSLGPPTDYVDVPKFAAISREQALVDAEHAGIVVIEKGSGNWVDRQIPPPGTPLRKGEAVEIHLSRHDTDPGQNPGGQIGSQGEAIKN